MKLFELKLDACISCNTSIVDARNLMRSISRAIVKRIINAAATLTKIQPVYPPIKSQLESRRSVWRARCPRIDAKADKWPVKTRGEGWKRAITPWAHRLMARSWQFSDAQRNSAGSNLSLRAKILQSPSLSRSVFQPGSLQGTRFSSIHRGCDGIFDWSNCRPMFK